MNMSVTSRSYRCDDGTTAFGLANKHPAVRFLRKGLTAAAAFEVMHTAAV